MYTEESMPRQNAEAVIQKRGVCTGQKNKKQIVCFMTELQRQ